VESIDTLQSDDERELGLGLEVEVASSSCLLSERLQSALSGSVFSSVLLRSCVSLSSRNSGFLSEETNSAESASLLLSSLLLILEKGLRDRLSGSLSRLCCLLAG